MGGQRGHVQDYSLSVREFVPGVVVDNITPIQVTKKRSNVPSLSSSKVDLY